MKTLIIVGLLTLASSVSASGINHDESTDWNKWNEVGRAQLSMFFFDIYNSQLLTPSGQYKVDKDITPHPLALSITYQRDISQQQLLDATVEQWEKLGFSYFQARTWAVELETIFPDIEEGHNITYVTDGQQGQFFHSVEASQQLIGAITDETLNDAFLAIWLSPDTEYPKLRQGLIGNNR
ncbi:chalcone isomerase family protein [Vibrio sp. TBV020]|uniref:chalcone isomerase family protein n=1 Tax=Vibrio sp. TBV020 TaxID=3137398 RepID=UPI0038CDA94A